MSAVFISHASKDDASASALERWLKANGFTDVFTDHENVAGGDRWDKALQAAAGACRVVLFLVTENWLHSFECFGEFKAAWYMGKRIVPLFLLPASAVLDVEAQKRFARLRNEDQGIDLLPCLNPNGQLDIDSDPRIAERVREGLRAAGALSQVGLDPQAFAIDRRLRPTPFPGLESFGDEDADAALFYGRNRDIGQTLEILRSMRALAEQRPLMVLGASGSGKSSLLKAGIIPRLRRETPAWLPLRAFRPGADPLLNFAEAIVKTLADFGEREALGVIRDQLFEVWQSVRPDEKSDLTEAGLVALETAIENLGTRLRKAADRAGATILISVDQAEEIARADGESTEALSDYLRVALAASKSPWQLAFTIRTDSFPELQNHRRFQNLEARGYDLRAIPVFRFDSVVEEPAKRYGVSVEPDLVYALMEDAPKEDALPLLAFALQRLWHQYAASGALTKLHYDKMGGMEGLIEDAAERAMCGIEPGDDVPLPPAPPKRQTDLAASTFVPTLAEVNDQGATIRHIAEWSQLIEEQRELLERFERWRLVVRKGDAEGGTVEVAHEALFRTWRRLKGWLEPERARLEALRALQVDAGNWERNGKNEIFLNHRSSRLAEATELGNSPSYASRLLPRDQDYIEACKKYEIKNESLAAINELKHQYKEVRFPFLTFSVTMFFTAIVSILLFMALTQDQYKNTIYIFLIADTPLLIIVFSILIEYIMTFRNSMALIPRIAKNMINAGLGKEIPEFISGPYLFNVMPKRPVFNLLAGRTLAFKAVKAHAYMLNAKAQKAKQLYLKYSGYRFPSQKMLWDDVIKADFDTFEKAGIALPIAAEIRAGLTGSKASQRAALIRIWRDRLMASAAVLLLIGVGWGAWNYRTEQLRLREHNIWQEVMKPTVMTSEEERRLSSKPGGIFAECANGCPQMVVVPAGQFVMGAQPDDKDQEDKEIPAHKVTIPRPFAVGKFAVTFAEWDMCTAAGVCPELKDSGWGRGNRPVVNVSWTEAKLYVAWLSRMTGKPYRLLSEAEWEYAARAGTVTRYYWGDEVGKNNANCRDCGSEWDDKQTAPSGSFKPNAFGLYDMTGNVGQWCEDTTQSTYQNKPDDLKSTGGPWIAAGNSDHIVRGGSYDIKPYALRSSYRESAEQTKHADYLGFRVARTLGD